MWSWAHAFFWYVFSIDHRTLHLLNPIVALLLSERFEWRPLLILRNRDLGGVKQFIRMHEIPNALTHLMKSAALRVSDFLRLREEGIGKRIVEAMPFRDEYQFIYKFLLRYADILSFVAL